MADSLPTPDDVPHAPAVSSPATTADDADALPYPPHLAVLERNLLGPGGATIHLRPITHDDDPAYREFALSLSPEAIYYRFFSPRSKLTEAEIAHFLTVDYTNRLAIVALDAGRIVGVGRYDRVDETTDAEVAFIVNDGYQGYGIASTMLRLLARAGRRHGITRLLASVLPDNKKMLGVFASSGWLISRHFEEGVIEVALDIERMDSIDPDTDRIGQRPRADLTRD